jgi:DNA-binding HxlR family transcriptional regulator
METVQYPTSREMRCPIDNTYRIMGKKFTVHIVREIAMRNKTHFNQFLTIEGINSNTLSRRLREMEKDGLIKRRVYHETPIRIEYDLTDKGEDLVPILEQMGAFSMKHAPEIFMDKKTTSFEEFFGREPKSL